MSKFQSVFVVAPIGGRVLNLAERRFQQRLEQLIGGSGWRMPNPLEKREAAILIQDRGDVDLLIFIGPGHEEEANRLYKLARKLGDKPQVWIVTDQGVTIIGDPQEFLNSLMKPFLASSLVERPVSHIRMAPTKLVRTVPI